MDELIRQFQEMTISNKISIEASDRDRDIDELINKLSNLTIEEKKNLKIYLKCSLETVSTVIPVWVY